MEFLYLFGIMVVCFVLSQLFLGGRGDSGKHCKHEWEVDLIESARNHGALKCKKCGAINNTR